MDDQKHHCLWDGHVFDGDGYSYPNSKKQNGKFGFDEATFCGPSCAKAYVDRVLQASPHLLCWIHLHIHRDLGIEEAVPIAPDPRLLTCNRRDSLGMSITQFRQFGMSHRLTEKINHIPIDLRVWIPEPQVNCTMPFHEVIRSERLVADMLFKDHKAKNLPIPITLLKEAAASDLKIQKEAEELKHLQNEQEKEESEVEEVEEEAKTMEPTTQPKRKKSKLSALSPMHPIHKKRKF